MSKKNYNSIGFKNKDIDRVSNDPPSTKSDTIKVSSTDQSLAKKKLQRKFNGKIPKGAKLTKKGDKYIYTVIKPK
tara:strand:- start:1051 stop:1275 length:225 start_codon:yes stop_codon:yes gene_type:complete